MSEMYLRQPEFIYSGCKSLKKNKNKTRIQKFKATRESIEIYIAVSIGMN